MAYDKQKIFEQAKEAIVKHKLFFVEDIVAFLPIAKKTFYEYYSVDSNECNELKGLLEINRTTLKVSMRSKWYTSNAPALQMALMKLIATPKPIPLCERAIKSSCPDNGLVLDVFLGSGLTMVASHQLKRKCYGMELDPKYCQVIINRMKNLEPTIIIKRNGEPYEN